MPVVTRQQIPMYIPKREVETEYWGTRKAARTMGTVRIRWTMRRLRNMADKSERELARLSALRAELADRGADR